MCNILYTLHVHRLSSEEICNEYVDQTMFCQSQAFPTEKSRNISGFCWFPKKPKAFIKARISTCGFKKANLTTLAHAAEPNFDWRNEVSSWYLCPTTHTVKLPWRKWPVDTWQYKPARTQRTKTVTNQETPIPKANGCVHIDHQCRINNSSKCSNCSGPALL